MIGNRAAMADASAILGVNLADDRVIPDAVAQIVAVTGFILAERARP
jgi:hypothetical protein